MKYRSRRKMTAFRVSLDTDWGKKEADIVDVTDRGARLRLSVGNLEEGAGVSLDIRGKSYSARVVWNKEGEAGVEFSEILPLDIQAAVNRSMHRPGIPKKKRFLLS